MWVTAVVLDVGVCSVTQGVSPTVISNGRRLNHMDLKHAEDKNNVNSFNYRICLP